MSLLKAAYRKGRRKRLPGDPYIYYTAIGLTQRNVLLADGWEILEGGLQGVSRATFSHWFMKKKDVTE